MSICGIILSRVGSKRLPGKNTKLLCEKPLIEWTIDAAIESGCFDTLVIGTDDIKVKAIINKNYWESEQPIEIIDLPKYLTTDNALSTECIMYIMDKIEKHDYIMLLQPTSPLRTVEDIKKFCEQGNVLNLFTHSRNELNNEVNGAMYIEKWDEYYKNRRFNENEELAYYMPETRSVDIDTELDFKVAEILMKEKLEVKNGTN